MKVTPTEMQINGTYSQYQNFVGSVIWKDIKEELIQWLENARSELEQENRTERIYRVQGVCEALRRVVDLPEQILQMLDVEPRRIRREDG